MNRKLFGLGMAAILSLSLCACGASNPPADSSADVSTPPASSAPVDSGSDSNTQAPAVTNQPVDLQAFSQTYIDAEQVPAALDLTTAGMGQDLMTASYPGLMELEPQQLVACISPMGINNSEMILIHVKDEADIPAIDTILRDRIDSMVEGGAFYPETVSIWTETAQVVANGNYVMLVVSEQADDIVAAFDALFEPVTAEDIANAVGSMFGQ